MEKNKKIENWLRGRVEGVSDLLQPAAHAFLQTKEEIAEYLTDFPKDKLWEKPSGRASVAFHLQHIAGVTNRLLTYARGKQLSEHQLQYLKAEGVENSEITLEELIENAQNSLEKGVEFLRNIEDNELTKKVEVGRKRIPSTLIGVLFHAAEHSQRHTGQMLVTISVLNDEDN